MWDSNQKTLKHLQRAMSSTQKCQCSHVQSSVKGEEYKIVTVNITQWEIHPKCAKIPAFRTWRTWEMFQPWEHLPLFSANMPCLHSCSLLPWFVIMPTPWCCEGPHKHQAQPLPSPSQGSAQPNLTPWDGPTTAEVGTGAGTAAARQYTFQCGNCQTVAVSGGKKILRPLPVGRWWGLSLPSSSWSVWLCFSLEVRGTPSLANWALVWIKILTTQKLPGLCHCHELSQTTTFPWIVFTSFFLFPNLCLC